MTKAGNSHKLPSLDGWRAVSIALVLAQHSAFTGGFPAILYPVLVNWFSLGGMGVCFFFVISGFLITWLLLQEQSKHGHISLKHFYLRRALRILPVYFFYLLVLRLLTHYEQPTELWVANLTFTTNYFPTLCGTGHFWSLGVEEQFYLLWPGLLLLLLRGRQEWKILGALLVPMVLAPVARLLQCKHWYPESLHCLFVNCSFLLQADALAYGCAAAVIFTHYRPALRVFLERHFRASLWGGAGLILTPCLLFLAHAPASLRISSMNCLWAGGFSLLLLPSVLFPERAPYRWLNWKWVCHLGVLSYSIYIWQELFCDMDKTIFGVKDGWWTRFPVWILFALLAAHASYYLLEKPLLGLRAKFREA